MPLFLIFVIVPIIEIALFIQVGGFLGLWPTLAIVVLTAFAGSSLLRSQGLSTLARLQSSMASGEDPSRDLAHGAMILIAGVVLLTPGFFTDTVGLLLMLPPVREWVIKAGGARMAANANIHVQRFDNNTASQEDIVDGDYEDVTTRKPKSPPSGWVQ